MTFSQTKTRRVSRERKGRRRNRRSSPSWIDSSCRLLEASILDQEARRSTAGDAGIEIMTADTAVAAFGLPPASDEAGKETRSAKHRPTDVPLPTRHGRLDRQNRNRQPPQEHSSAAHTTVLAPVLSSSRLPPPSTLSDEVDPHPSLFLPLFLSPPSSSLLGSNSYSLGYPCPLAEEAPMWRI